MSYRGLVAQGRHILSGMSQEYPNCPTPSQVHYRYANRKVIIKAASAIVREHKAALREKSKMTHNAWIAKHVWGDCKREVKRRPMAK